MAEELKHKDDPTLKVGEKCWWELGGKRYEGYVVVNEVFDPPIPLDSDDPRLSGTFDPPLTFGGKDNG